MWQRLIVSSFVGLGSLFLVASAQQPAKPGSAETKAEAAPVPTPGQPGKGGGAAGGRKKPIRRMRFYMPRWQTTPI